MRGRRLAMLRVTAPEEPRPADEGTEPADEDEEE
jgi:hypothetical protein